MESNSFNPLHRISHFAQTVLINCGWNPNSSRASVRGSPCVTTATWEKFVLAFCSDCGRSMAFDHPARTIVEALYGLEVVVPYAEVQETHVLFKVPRHCDPDDVATLGKLLGRCLVPVAEIRSEAYILVAEDEATFMLGSACPGVFYVADTFADALDKILRGDQLRPVYFTEEVPKEFRLPDVDATTQDVYIPGRE